MIRAIVYSIGQLGERRILGLLALALGIALALFIALGWALRGALAGFDACALVSSRSCAIGESTLPAVLMTLAAVWLLFPAVAIGVTSLFADRIVAAVERRRYPALAQQARTVGLGESIGLSLASVARLVGWNLLALPFYLLLLFTGVGAVALFLAVNALALGRDLAEMVMACHADRAARRAWLATTRGDRALIGLVATGLFMVPVANLLAPVLAPMIATHRLLGRREAQ